MRPMASDLREANAKAAAEVMASAGYDVSATVVDASSREAVDALVELATAIGSVVGLIHSAGVSPTQATPATILKVDLYGTALVLERFAASLHSLGMLLRAGHAYAEARPLLERALAIREKALGSDHPDVAKSLDGLASLLEAEGSLDRARPYFERTLALTEAIARARLSALSARQRNLPTRVRRRTSEFSGEPRWFAPRRAAG
jgi:tetratricopeptide (TPR) repeat protein